MMENLARQSVISLARTQLEMFHTLGDRVSLTEDDRRRSLDLDDPTWREWTAFLSDGPLPPSPPLTEMLRRLGETTFNLTIMAERPDVRRLTDCEARHPVHRSAP